MTAAEFAKLVNRPRQRSNGWWNAVCPGHPDDKGSLEFRDGDRGLIIKCQAGCELDRICAAVGRRVADLFHDRTDRQAEPAPRKIVATYDYVDEGGKLVSQTVRYSPKAFNQRRPDGNGGWIWNLKGVERVVYRLPELRGRARAYNCEGEKDCDNLWKAGLAATTNAEGAGKWRPGDTASLISAGVRELVILPDNDAAGEAHAKKVASSGIAAGLSVKILRLSGLPPKGDVSDWLATGHGAAELEALADAAPLVTVQELQQDDLEPGAAEARWQPPGDRPVIDTGNLGLAEMADATWTAIEAANDPPRIYRYGGALAWLGEDPVGRPQIEVMGQDHVRHHLAHVATFVRWTAGRPGRAPEQKPAFPPVPLAADLLTVPRATVPRLHRLVRVPVFTATGELLTRPGYDPTSGLYFAPPAGLTIPDVVEAPDAETVATAREVLLELVADFPFLAPADRAHALALLLTTFLREMIPGNVPLFVVSKPTPRTGAGLLVKVISLIQTGTPVPATTVSRDEEENRKRFLAFLLGSPAMILLDNLHGRLDSPALAAILTSWPTWHDRLLGKSQDVHVPVTATFVVTGNNIALSNEMTGRSVLIRLDPKVEDPSTRTGFRHPKLETWTAERRGRLLWATLTLGQAWIAAGRPLADIAFGGFEAWTGTLGGVLKVAGVREFLGNRQTLFDQSDEETAHIRAFLADWWAKHGSGDVVVNELLDIARGHALNIAGKSDHAQLIRLGLLVATLKDRRYDLGEGLALAVRRGGQLRRAVLWHLDKCECVSAVSVAPVIAHGHAPAREREEEGPPEQTHKTHNTHQDAEEGLPF